MRIQMIGQPWHYDPADKFWVKSAYKLTVQIRDHITGNDAFFSNSNDSNAFGWHKLRQLKVPNKVKRSAALVRKRLDEDCGRLFLSFFFQM